MFPGTLISRLEDIIWPSRSTDLAAPDKCLRGYVKSKVYKIRPAITDDIQTANLFKEPLKEMLCVMTTFPSQMQDCAARRDGRLQSVILKQ
jgi:hypothetical protein